MNLLIFKTREFAFYSIQIASFDLLSSGNLLYTFCLLVWKLIVIERIGMRFERIGKRWKLLTFRVRIDLALKKVIKWECKVPLGNMHYWCTILRRFFTKTRANLSTYSRKLGNYNGTIIFQVATIKKFFPIN